MNQMCLFVVPLFGGFDRGVYMMINLPCLPVDTRYLRYDFDSSLCFVVSLVFWSIWYIIV